MRRTSRCGFFWLVFSSACALSLMCERALAATGLPMNFSEARNLPSWIHLETDPACKGFADDCTTVDGTTVTGYSFTETGLGGGSSATGGESQFNVVTLPNGVTGLSGQAVDTGSGTGTTTSMASLRILAGAPDSLRLWVVVDNGMDPNFNGQGRLRVNLRDTTGPPGYGDASAAAEAEALPNGQRLDNAVNTNARDGWADAWSFLLTGVNEHDRINIRPSSLAGDFGAFAGIMIEPLPPAGGGANSIVWEAANSIIGTDATPDYTGLASFHWFPAFGIPEPSSALLIVLGACTLSQLARRRRS